MNSTSFPQLCGGAHLWRLQIRDESWQLSGQKFRSPWPSKGEDQRRALGITAIRRLRGGWEINFR